MTSLRMRAFAALEARYGHAVEKDEHGEPYTALIPFVAAVDALLAAGMLHDPADEKRVERAARTLCERSRIALPIAQWMDDARAALAAADPPPQADAFGELVDRVARGRGCA